MDKRATLLKKMKVIMLKRLLIILCSFILISACNLDTVVKDSVEFSGEGKYWRAKYIYDEKMYRDKKVNWIEMQYKDTHGSNSNLNLNDIDIQLKSRDGVIKGNLGKMHVQVIGNVIKFLVGTVNTTTYKEDRFELRVKFLDKEDVVKLRVT